MSTAKKISNAINVISILINVTTIKCYYITLSKYAIANLQERRI